MMKAGKKLEVVGKFDHAMFQQTMPVSFSSAIASAIDRGHVTLMKVEDARNEKEDVVVIVAPAHYHRDFERFLERLR